jgi:hypothetical protein
MMSSGIQLAEIHFLTMRSKVGGRSKCPRLSLIVTSAGALSGRCA